MAKNLPKQLSTKMLESWAKDNASKKSSALNRASKAGKATEMFYPGGKRRVSEMLNAHKHSGEKRKY